MWLYDQQLTCTQRSTGELATYQKKLIRIDDHVGVAIAGLTSDARVLRYVTPCLVGLTLTDSLSNFMRQQAMSSKMLYGRPIPVARIVQGISDRKFSLPSSTCTDRGAIKLTLVKERSTTLKCTESDHTVSDSSSLARM